MTLFFILATFYTQVTMLNMLIAIMGDQFDYATENRIGFATSAKIDMVSSQAPALSTAAAFDETKVFMIVVTVVEDEDESNNDWIGTISKIDALNTQ